MLSPDSGSRAYDLRHGFILCYLYIYYKMRNKKNKSLQRQMCTRLVELLERHLQMSDTEAARALGYRSASTLWKIRRGIAFVDVEKLAALAALRARKARPNIDWLVSGSGSPLIATKSQQSTESSLTTSLARLSVTQLSALEALVEALLQQTPRRRRVGRRNLST
jgi:hypothetical protein